MLWVYLLSVVLLVISSVSGLVLGFVLFVSACNCATRGPRAPFVSRSRSKTRIAYVARQEATVGHAAFLRQEWDKWASNRRIPTIGMGLSLVPVGYSVHHRGCGGVLKC